MQKLRNEELNRKSVEEFRKAGKIPVLLVLDHLRSLNNVGSIFRTADAFLVEKIYLCGITACPPHREIQKTALGATESVIWEYRRETPPLIEQLKEEGYHIISLEQVQGSVSLEKYHFVFGKKYALIFGHEVKGVSQAVINLSHECLEIPQFGTKHSFNVAVSAGIVLWDYFLKTSKSNKKGGQK
ncbi:MAG: RNA methyltransferase [Bacteroidales bacterium]